MFSDDSSKLSIADRRIGFPLVGKAMHIPDFFCEFEEIRFCYRIELKGLQVIKSVIVKLVYALAQQFPLTLRNKVGRYSKIRHAWKTLTRKESKQVQQCFLLKIPPCQILDHIFKFVEQQYETFQARCSRNQIKVS